MKYVLIACEESQTECKAFREVGTVAYSCDIQACSGGHPEWHIRADVTSFLQGRRYFKTEDGKEHHVPKWDLIICHPPCTYLSKAGANHLVKHGCIDEVRYAYGIVAKDFFQKCLAAKAEHVAVENPIPLAIFKLPKCSQAIQPWEFGEPYTKKTYLWLKNLPPLMATCISTGRKQWVKSTRKQRKRSKSFEGIAKAMAEQWIKVI